MRDRMAPAYGDLVLRRKHGDTVTYADTGSGIDLATLRILLDGGDITAACFMWPTMAG